MGVSAPTLAAAGVYIPIAGASSAAAEIVDPEGATAAAVSAAMTDRAGTDGGAGASAPTLAAAGAYIPITEATSAAEIVDPEGAPTVWRARARRRPIRPAGAAPPAPGAPTLAASGTYTPATGATSAAEIGRRLQSGGRERAMTDPAGGDRAAGASAPTLAAPGASIPATGTTSAAAQNSLPARHIHPFGPDHAASPTHEARTPAPTPPRRRPTWPARTAVHMR